VYTFSSKVAFDIMSVFRTSDMMSAFRTFDMMSVLQTFDMMSVFRTFDIKSVFLTFDIMSVFRRPPVQVLSFTHMPERTFQVLLGFFLVR
jgi:hypothetical protein